jgi:ATP-binding cassette subfamily F protein 3
MSLITTQKISKSYGPDDIFSGLNLTIPPDGRIALVGENGIGKTTLLKVLAGLESPSEGKIQTASGLDIGYLPQGGDLTSNGTLWDEALSALEQIQVMEKELGDLEQALSRKGDGNPELMARYGNLQAEFERRGGYSYEKRIQQVLAGLGFKKSDFQMPIDHLSGGQRTRALLSKLLLSQVDLLVFDEPTNHLDIDAIEWLEGYLKAYSGAVLLVSHDRYFIDQVCNQIWEMSRAGFETYRGNYSAYLEQRQDRWLRQQETFEAEKSRLVNELDYIKRNIAGQNTNLAQGKLRRLSRRVQAIEQIGLQAVQGKSWSEISREVSTTTSPMSVQEAHQRIGALRNPVKQPQQLSLRLGTRQRGGDLVLRTYNLKIGYPDGDKALFSAPDITLLRGECAALIGPNGAGKTSFLKTILGELEPWGGEVKLGANLDVGYFAQAHQNLVDNHTVLEEIASAGSFQNEGAIRSYLAPFLFSGDEVYKTVSVLSGGERGRLALAKLSLSNANLLLLDEPTNHLDIPSQEALQAVLTDYPGTVLLVSHDRYLINSLASQIWEIDVKEAGLIVFEGSYQDYHQHLEDQHQAEKIEKEENDSSEISYRDQKAAKNRALAQERQRAARLEEVETRIAELETLLEKISLKLAEPPQDPGEVIQLGTKYGEAEQELGKLLGEWEELVQD